MLRMITIERKVPSIPGKTDVLICLRKVDVSTGVWGGREEGKAKDVKTLTKRYCFYYVRHKRI